MDMGRNLRNRPDGKSERSSLDASKTLKGYEYLMKHEYSVENVMRCARLSSIAYIHDKTSDLPGYIYIYINIAPLSNVRREKQAIRIRLCPFLRRITLAIVHENSKPDVENATTWSSVVAV